jgi:hypothetical protein
MLGSSLDMWSSGLLIKTKNSIAVFNFFPFPPQKNTPNIPKLLRNFAFCEYLAYFAAVASIFLANSHQKRCPR